MRALFSNSSKSADIRASRVTSGPVVRAVCIRDGRDPKQLMQTDHSGEEVLKA